MALAADLLDRYPRISTRDAVHAATMLNNGLSKIVTSDDHFDEIQEIRRLKFSDV
jgi:predicted nucleic acid-binding protein